MIGMLNSQWHDGNFVIQMTAQILTIHKKSSLEYYWSYWVEIWQIKWHPNFFLLDCMTIVIGRTQTHTHTDTHNSSSLVSIIKWSHRATKSKQQSHANSRKLAFTFKIEVMWLRFANTTMNMFVHKTRHPNCLLHGTCKNDVEVAKLAEVGDLVVGFVGANENNFRHKIRFGLAKPNELYCLSSTYSCHTLRTYVRTFYWLKHFRYCTKINNWNEKWTSFRIYGRIFMSCWHDLDAVCLYIALLCI